MCGVQRHGPHSGQYLMSHDHIDGHEHLQCVLRGYNQCAARIPGACICSQMPLGTYLRMWNKKYGAEGDKPLPEVGLVRGGEIGGSVQ